MDERMSREKHVESICSIRLVPGLVHAMRRLKPFLSLSTLKILYNAIVQPYFNYCSPIWDNCGIDLKDKLQKSQNRAARVITGTTMIFDHLMYILANLNRKPPKERRNYLKTTLIYKILNGHTAPNLKEAFRFNNERIRQEALQLKWGLALEQS